jgi:8-oxo-dGTP diphosphatase
VSQKRFALSAKVIIRDEKDRCLLIKRSLNTRGNPGQWDLPGGKVEHGEDFDLALLREVEEECGLPVQLDHVVGAAEWDLGDRMVSYIILEGHPLGRQITLSEEHIDHVWVPREGLREQRDLCVQFRSFIVGYSRSEGV